MQTNIPKSEKISGGLGNLYVGDWKEGGIRADILHLVSCYFQRSDQGLVGLKRRS